LADGCRSPARWRVAQAVGRVPLPIADVEVARPVVPRVIVAVTDQLVGGQGAAEHDAHHRAVEHHRPLMEAIIARRRRRPVGQDVQPPLGILPRAPDAPGPDESQVAGQLQPEDPGIG
jgi:hypothetical protein